MITFNLDYNDVITNDVHIKVNLIADLFVKFYLSFFLSFYRLNLNN